MQSKKSIKASALLNMSAEKSLAVGATYAQWRGVREPLLRSLSLRDWAEEDYALLGEWQEAEAIAIIKADEQARLEALWEVSGNGPPSSGLFLPVSWRPLDGLWRA